MKPVHIASIAALAWLLAAPAAFAEVQLTIQDGRVSIVAKDATLRQILAEWARVGQTKIVNVDRIPGGPMTLELRNVPEEQALDVLMRSLSGYLAAPRPTQFSAPNLSRYDRIIVMPTVAAARTAVASGAPPPPVFQQPQIVQPVATIEDDPNDERAGANAVIQNPGAPRPPIFGAFPQPQVVNTGAQPVTGGQPAGGTVPFMQPAVVGAPVAQPTTPPPPAAPTGFPSSVGGVSVPGMIVPTPQQPGTVPQPGIQPPQTRRPGGPGGQ